jgi:hypothetical protein
MVPWTATRTFHSSDSSFALQHIDADRAAACDRLKVPCFVRQIFKNHKEKVAFKRAIWEVSPRNQLEG